MYKIIYILPSSGTVYLRQINQKVSLMIELYLYKNVRKIDSAEVQVNINKTCNTYFYEL